MHRPSSTARCSEKTDRVCGGRVPPERQAGAPATRSQGPPLLWGPGEVSSSRGNWHVVPGGAPDRPFRLTLVGAQAGTVPATRRTARRHSHPLRTHEPSLDAPRRLRRRGMPARKCRPGADHHRVRRLRLLHQRQPAPHPRWWRLLVPAVVLGQLRQRDRRHRLPGIGRDRERARTISNNNGSFRPAENGSVHRHDRSRLPIRRRRRADLHQLRLPARARQH